MVYAKKIAILFTILFILSIAAYSQKTAEKREMLYFSGYEWYKRESNGYEGPGRNLFLAENVWLDDKGQIHLKIRYIDGKWTCAETFTKEAFGYGDYYFFVRGRVDELDPNVVMGLFIYENDKQEIDIEFARWGYTSNPNAQYVVQPWYHRGNIHRFNMMLGQENTTHLISWRENSIYFKSWYGHCINPPDDWIIEEWTYYGDDNPLPDNEQVHINLWLYDKNGNGCGDAPSDGKEVEVVITKFIFVSSHDKIVYRNSEKIEYVLKRIS